MSGFWDTQVHYLVVITHWSELLSGSLQSNVQARKKQKKKYLLQHVVLWKGRLFSASVTELCLSLHSLCQDSKRENNIFFQCKHKYLVASRPHIVTESLENSSLLTQVITGKSLVWMAAGALLQNVVHREAGIEPVWWMHGSLSFGSLSNWVTDSRNDLPKQGSATGIRVCQSLWWVWRQMHNLRMPVTRYKVQKDWFQCSDTTHSSPFCLGEYNYLGHMLPSCRGDLLWWSDFFCCIPVSDCI